MKKYIRLHIDNESESKEAVLFLKGQDDIMLTIIPAPLGSSPPYITFGRGGGSEKVYGLDNIKKTFAE